MTLVKGTVDDLLAQQPDPFDVVLVDGDHHQGPCYRDLWACEQLVKPDGVRLVHDYKAVPNTHVTGQRGRREGRKVVFTQVRLQGASGGRFGRGNATPLSGNVKRPPASAQKSRPHPNAVDKTGMQPAYWGEPKP